MPLFRFEGVIFVEAPDKRQAEHRISDAFSSSSRGKKVLPHLHWWTRLKSMCCHVQPCCGAEVPAHAPNCGEHPIENVVDVWIDSIPEGTTLADLAKLDETPGKRE